MFYKDVKEVISESSIICVSPHYDDFLFFLGGYALELRRAGLLCTKRFTNISTFSRSNYQERDAEGNKDTSLSRVQYATGIRIIEDLQCLDALLGAHGYVYRILGENESQLRGKILNEGDDEMEMAFGSYDTMNNEDRKVLDRVTSVIRALALQDDTAIVLPLSMKGHIDHFIVREAGVAAMKENPGHARFYFAEDKPYAGLLNEQENKINNDFIEKYKLDDIGFPFNPDEIIRLAYEHYPSQVDAVYDKGVFARSEQLKAYYSMDCGCDRLYVCKK
jgi:LmbE family N-acetylglucosaminyl deacetylase